MKMHIVLTALLMVSAGLSASAQTTCDDFNRPNSTIVTGWTEQIGDWTISNNALLSPSNGTWNYITYNGSAQADGCISARATYGPSTQIKFMGLLARYASDVSNIMVKIQDSGPVGYWNSYFFYCNNSNITYVNTGLNFGTDANIQVEYTGPNITLRVDPDRNGTWDYTYTAVLSNTSAGFCGAASYQQCYLDDWCYGTSCCTTAPDPAGTISGSPVVCAGQNGVSYSVPGISGATSYVWTYSGAGATVNGTGNSITINFSGAATSGTLTVYGTNPCGNGTPSNAYQITVDPCTGENEIPATGNIRVFPDPGPGMFSVLMDAMKSTACKVNVHDITGRLIYVSDRLLIAGTNRYDIDLTGQPAGIYYLDIMNDDSRAVKLLMIAR